jgi:sec-independent protein translocase protein TatA
MLGNLNGWHLVVLLAVVLLLFGAPKLPGLARSIGQSMRIFRSEVRTMKDENGATVVDDAADELVDDTPADAKPATNSSTAKRTTAKSSTKPKS